MRFLWRLIEQIVSQSAGSRSLTNRDRSHSSLILLMEDREEKPQRQVLKIMNYQRNSNILSS